jgi:alpha-ribazole phosphatase
MRQLLLLRHGEVDGGRCLFGQTDVPLTAHGWGQMQAAADGAGPWDGVVSSPLSRCADFAAAVARERDLPVIFDTRLREIDFGEWEGAPIAELMQRSDGALSRFWQDPERHPPPGGEHLAAFCSRVGDAWDALVESPVGERVLIVTHGGVIRALFSRLLARPCNRLLDFDVPHAGIYRVDVIGNGTGNRTVQPHSVPGQWQP